MEMLSLVERWRNSKIVYLPNSLAGKEERVVIRQSIGWKSRYSSLDEPLSALDPFLRRQMRAELKQLAKWETKYHFCSRDPLPRSDGACRSGCRMRDGQIEQADKPRTVFKEPVNEFVAEFLGDQNILIGQIISAKGKTLTVEGPGDLRFPISSTNFSIGDKLNLVLRSDGLVLGKY